MNWSGICGFGSAARPSAAVRQAAPAQALVASLLLLRALDAIARVAERLRQRILRIGRRLRCRHLAIEV
ncbi:MAG: hypothetical protein U0Q11_02940 [Vicinamibacterales bacterium]